MFRRRGVALKLALLGLIPLLVLLGAAFRVASEGSQEVGDLRSFQNSIEIAVAAGELRSRLEAERSSSLFRLSESGQALGAREVRDVRGPTSRALETFNRLVSDKGSEATPRVRALARRARQDDLTRLRVQIDNLETTSAAAGRAFDARAGVLEDLIGRVDEEIPTPELINETLAYSALSSVVAPAWRERDEMTAALVAGGVQEGAESDLRSLVAEQGAFSREFLRKATGGPYDAWKAVERDSASAQVEIVRSAVLDGGDGESEVPLSVWLSASGERVYDILEVQSIQGEQLRTRVAEEVSAARRGVVTQLGLLSIALLVLLVGGALLAGSITRPLSRVAREARRVGRGEEPGGLPSAGPDEIGDVTTALSGLTETIGGLQSDAERVLSAVQAGDLSARANPSMFSGFWATIPTGVNQILDEFAALGGRFEDEAARQRLLATASAEALTVESGPAFQGTIAGLVQQGMSACRVGLIDCPPEGPNVLLTAAGREWPTLPPDVAEWHRLIPETGTATVEPLGEIAHAAAARVAMPDRADACLYVERANSDFSDEELSFLSTAASLLAQAEGRAWAEDRLRRQSIHDELTGLPNRAFFEGSVRRSGEAGLDDGTTHTILIADVNRFQRINESLGHGAGDVLLAEVAQRINDSVPTGGLLARFGADEFIVHLDDRVAPVSPEAFVDDLRRCFEDPFEATGSPVRMGVSIGYAQGSGRDAAAGRLASNADTALRMAKAEPGSAVQRFTEGQDAAVARRSWLETALWEAVNNADMDVHYQPIVELPSGRTVAVEALARWAGSDDVAPVEFIPVAEELGLIGKLDAVVRGRAIRWAADLPGSRPPDISLNLSPRQLDDPDLPRSLKAAITDTGIDPERIVLEITESAIVGEEESTLAALDALKDLGVKMVIDDFGTGYSSFAYLARLPIDGVKIDRAFVNGADTPNHVTVLSSIIKLCRELELTVTAEGVETREELDMLLDMGCDRVQGYFLARPAPPGDLDLDVMSVVEVPDPAA